VSGAVEDAGRGASDRQVAARERVCVALDVPTLDDASDLARRLAGEVGWFKVGLELFGAHGPEAVRAIATHGPVFLDLKLHDIPTTVGRAAQRLGALGVGLLTVHAGGGAAMVRAAVDGLAGGADAGSEGSSAGRVLAVTVLTSMSDEDLASVNAPAATTQVPALAELAVRAGAPGLVCAPRDLGRVRETVGPEPLLVTPGIRPAGSGEDDHARAATPASAVAGGADLLVVGRPITRADDPVAAARAIVGELDQAHA
jgi:orotidine-5'-phosphate decarboxylase